MSTKEIPVQDFIDLYMPASVRVREMVQRMDKADEFEPITDEERNDPSYIGDGE